jgi:acetyl-CoA carboxylase biotin carboxylase subunit
MDTHLTAGCEIPRHYDSMIAKLMVHGDDRAEAIAIGIRALSEIRVEGPGIHTTTSLHRRLLHEADFISGNIDTGYLGRLLED